VIDQFQRVKGGPAMAELVSVPLRAKPSDSGSGDGARPVRGWIGGQAPPVGPSDGTDLREVYQVIRRRKGIIIGCMVLITALTVVGVFQITPRYTAESIIMVDTRKNQVADIQSVLSGLGSDSVAIRSEIEVLKSPTLAERVAKKLKLIDDPEFMPPVVAREPLLVRLGVADWLAGSLELLGISTAPPSPGKSPEEQAQDLLDATSLKAQKGLTVINDGRSLVLKVRFESESPTLSSSIVDTYADLYLLEQLEAKYAAVRRANEWLNTNLTELRGKVQSTERAVQLFKEGNNLTESRGTTVTAQQLTELNSQLIVASGDRAQKEANLREVQNLVKSPSGMGSSSQVLASPLIQRLSEQESELRRKEAELATRYKPAHPAMLNIRAEITDLDRKMTEEVNKIARGLSNDLNVARARETALQSTLRGLQQSTVQQSKSEVQLRELERDAEANRTLYENLLKRFKQTSTQEDIQQADARLIAYAKPPKTPSYPNKTLLVELAALGSLLLGILLAFVIERLDNGFRTSDQIEKQAGLPVLGLVPGVKANRVPVDVVVDQPVAAYSEAIRSIRTALRFSDVDNPPKIVMVTSSLPAEGKTCFAASLARSVAASGGRALLIDCDLRHPSVGKLFGATGDAVGPGLVALFTEGADTSKMVQVDEKSGMHFIPSRGGTSNPQDLLGSAQMSKFLKAMRMQYDVIVIDAPPVLAVSDALVLSHLADATLFLVRWERTPRAITIGALKSLRAQGGRVAGAVLSRVNVKKHAKYGYGDSAYYYGYYGGYYSGEKA
jgi:succinoglycan biosynthesis transport protein ExoP